MRLLHSWYSTLNLGVSLSGALLQPLAVSNGVRQGGVLSPILFPLYLDELLLRLVPLVSLNWCLGVFGAYVSLVPLVSWCLSLAPGCPRNPEVPETSGAPRTPRYQGQNTRGTKDTRDNHAPRTRHQRHQGHQRQPCTKDKTPEAPRTPETTMHQGQDTRGTKDTRDNHAPRTRHQGHQRQPCTKNKTPEVPRTPETTMHQGQDTRGTKDTRDNHAPRTRHQRHQGHQRHPGTKYTQEPKIRELSVRKLSSSCLYAPVEYTRGHATRTIENFLNSVFIFRTCSVGKIGMGGCELRLYFMSEGFCSTEFQRF